MTCGVDQQPMQGQYLTSPPPWYALLRDSHREPRDTAISWSTPQQLAKYFCIHVTMQLQSYLEKDRWTLVYTSCIQQLHIAKLLSHDTRCSIDLSVTKASMLPILLIHLISMLQLLSRQPHVLRAVKTHKWSQVLHFTLTLTVAFYFSNFVFRLAINFDWWYISMNTVTEPTAKQRDMKHIMNTTQRSTARQIQTIGHIPNTQ